MAFCEPKADAAYRECTQSEGMRLPCTLADDQGNTFRARIKCTRPARDQGTAWPVVSWILFTIRAFPR